MNWMLCRDFFEPDFGINLNKVDGEAPRSPPPPLTESEPEVSSNAATPERAAPAPAPATTAKTGRSGEINCPVITCGIWE